MKSRIERFEKYRSSIATAPEWTFKLSKKRSSRYNVDAVMDGKSIGSKAISLDSEKKSPRMVGYEKYQQGKQSLMILKYTLFAVSIILMIVLYVIWVRK